MSGTGSARTIVVDASVAINFLHIARLDLLAGLPGYVCAAPEDVVAEITEPTQAAQLQRAIADGLLRIETITDPDDLVQYAELRRTLGRGESACLVLAARHGWLLASDEKGRFQREAWTRLGADRVVNTAGLLVAAIRAGLISIEDADQAKSTLEHHRFRLLFRSFNEIV